MDNLELTLSLISIIAGFLGVIIGAKYTSIIARRRSKTEFIYDLHKEINNVEMIKHRMKAKKILAQNYPESLYELITKIPDELHSVWVITAFYERLYLALKYNQINEKLFVPVFGNLFCFFYYGFLKEQFKRINKEQKPWDTEEYFQKLETEFRKRAGTEKWLKLKDTGQKEGDVVIAEYQTKVETKEE